MIVSEVGADVCKLALQEIYKEVELLINEPVDEKELSTVKKYLAGEFIRMFDGALETSSAWRAADDFGMDFSYFKKYMQAILKATPAQLQKIAGRYLQRENFHEIVAGKK
jgi:predicted Zn-dependent peptidase